MQNRKIINYKVLNVSPNEVDIELYDEIGEYIDWSTWSIKGVTYENFKKDFENAIASFQKVNLRINSYGGDVNTGLSIYNLIQRHEDKNIHVYIDVAAYSIAGLIAQAVKKGNRHAAKNATILIHEASTYIWDSQNATQLREMADMLDICNETIAISMSDTMGISVDDFKSKYFDGKDHLFTAQEALDAGLIDDIVSTTKSDDNKKTKAVSSQTPPRDFIERIAAKVSNILKPNQEKQSIMNLDEIKNIVSGDGDITPEQRQQISDVIDRFNTAKFTEEEVTAKVESARNETTASLQSTIDALNTEITALKTSIEEIKGAGGGSPSGAKDGDTVNNAEKVYTPIRFTF